MWSATGARLLIPPQRIYPDDDELLHEAVVKLAALEERSEEDVRLDITEPLVDTLDIRTLPATPSGTIPLLSGAKAVDSIVEILDTSARTFEEGARLIFSGRRSSGVQEFLSQVRLGVSKPGSYIFTARIPVATSSHHQASLFDDEEPAPLGRQVLETLERALRAAHTACDRVIRGTATFDVIEDYVEDGLSADFCEALSGLAGQGTDRPFDVSFGWARGLAAPSSETIRFSATMASVLGQAAKQLRELARVGHATITGMIEDLHDDGVGSPRIKIRGELQTSADTVTRAVWVVVDNVTYGQAGDLHYRRLPVQVSGDLVMTGTRLELRPDSEGLRTP
ncbi:hypothetical protein DP939_05815 [Spongiactinospora rosea]|uniref:Uncharacterized protein n=1 Tax=Spongiactinospora rosea TaxID=2248750 RepID=A0A366M2Y2_9ACTN|nr:hypothetical protein DP939_05815 [Spongiactinospora rosea]